MMKFLGSKKKGQKSRIGGRPGRIRMPSTLLTAKTMMSSRDNENKYRMMRKHRNWKKSTVSTEIEENS